MVVKRIPFIHLQYCGDCDMPAAMSMPDLLKHQKEECPEKKTNKETKFQCNKCDRSFGYKQNLKFHIQQYNRKIHNHTLRGSRRVERSKSRLAS